MSQRVLDEREYRRGLVLGLTLAEIMILLLFLLLLALGTRLEQMGRELGLAGSKRDQYKNQPDRHTAAAEQTDKEHGDLKKQNEKLKKEMDEVRPILEAARNIDPNEPPAALIKRIERVIAGLRPEDLKIVSQMSAGDTLTVTIVKFGKDSSEGKVGTKADGEHNWPPIITLSDASGYFFRAGSAEPSPEFRAKLTGSVVDQILKTIKEYKVDVIEVIGHTDEQPVYTRPPSPPEPPVPFGFPSFGQAASPVHRYPNLDATLIPFLNGQEALENVLAFDNAGLGLARAAAVARILLQENRLRQYRILPLSAGQLIQGGEILSSGSPGNARHRRRIEIRMRRSDVSSQPR